MKGMKTKINDSDLRAAIRKFLDSGGIIKKLPDEKTSESQMVGRRWNTAEIASEPN